MKRVRGSSSGEALFALLIPVLWGVIQWAATGGPEPPQPQGHTPTALHTLAAAR